MCEGTNIPQPPNVDEDLQRNLQVYQIWILYGVDNDHRLMGKTACSLKETLVISEQDTVS
jgi:hypothetical protein